MTDQPRWAPPDNQAPYWPSAPPPHQGEGQPSHLTNQQPPYNQPDHPHGQQTAPYPPMAGYGGPEQPRDPRRPFTDSTTPAHGPAQFAPRREWSLLWIFLAALVIIAAVILVPWFAADRPAATPSATQDKAVAPSPATTPDENSIPWETSTGKGLWQIDRSEFGSHLLTVTMTLQVTEGLLSYDWFVFGSDSEEAIEPEYSGDNPLRPGTLASGQSVSGTVSFRVPPGPVTVVLANLDGPQITALQVRP